MPRTSRNPNLQALAKNKRKICVLNKTDLADPRQTEFWANRYKSEYDCVITNGIDEKETYRGIFKFLRGCGGINYRILRHFRVSCFTEFNSASLGYSECWEIHSD